MQDRQQSVPTDYSSYLLIDDLLRLQRPLTPGAGDEMLFIVVHQAYELWFKLLLHELGRAREALIDTGAHAATAPLRRVTAVERLLLEQLAVLETMSPDAFLAFRDPLAPASGFQSAQFREIELLSGLQDRAARDDLRLPPEDLARLRARGGEASLWDAFRGAARRIGLDLPDGEGAAERSRRLDALASLYRDHGDVERSVLHQVAELLVDHDEAVATWRFRHALMASRQIGARTGTGGSSGVGYLLSTVDQRFYPELWEVRSRL